MIKFKKALWFTLGIVLLGVAYIGLITPGIPWSTPTVGAAFCFSKSSDRWHNWIMNHRLFGPFLLNWKEKRIFPTKAKWAMVLTMDSSLVILWFTTHNWKAVLGLGIAMMLVAVWALRYPGSVEDWEKQQKL
jgi:uncharacterized membrane protein YbaN (DUF454 family)